MSSPLRNRTKINLRNRTNKTTASITTDCGYIELMKTSGLLPLVSIVQQLIVFSACHAAGNNSRYDEPSAGKEAASCIGKYKTNLVGHCSIKCNHSHRPDDDTWYEEDYQQ